MPSNYDAFLVTTQRMKPDGTIGVFVGDYELTEQDKRNLEAWRQAGIAERQRQYDLAAAQQALNLASQPAAPGWASAGPGAPVSSNPGAALALTYADSITDPVGRTQVTQAIDAMIQRSSAGLTPGQAGAVLPVTTGGGSSYYPATGGFPEIGAAGPEFGTTPGGSSGGQSAAPAASGDTMKIILAALGALALFN